MRKIGIGIGTILIIALALFILIEDPNNSNSDIKDVGLSQEEVEEGLDLQENGADGTYVVNLLEGSFEGEVKGTVLSDTDCEADEEGISRCHNEIELENQKELKIKNPHNMQNNRCLSPGETIHLSKNQEGKIVVQLTET
ncbi:hypothetical protein [Alkalibacillus aidingensis]|uniref:hypothetical protein n=1 Tax=Alkalibacillus aidingensis TaxID=2747607 RepID=UPI00166116FA|nr:hypothetical protein [Alkalibacillus aidingensis]